MEFKSAAKPSLYAYPAPLEEKKSEEREKVATAVLSIAARQKRRETADKKDDEKMDVDEDSKDASTKKEDEKMKVDEPPTKDDKKKKDEKDKEKEKEKSKDDDKDKDTSASTSTSGDNKDKEKKDDKKEKKEPEPNFEILQNPPRVMRQQLKVLSVAEGQTFVPLKDVTIGGIIVMQHNGKIDDQELVEPVAAYGPKNEDVKEPEPPEPFEYIED